MENGKEATVWEVQTLSPFSLFLTFLSLFIDYVKVLWKYEMLSEWCSKWAVTEWCRENLLLLRTRGLLWVCNFPTLLAEGLIKYLRKVSLLFYLLEGKGMLTSSELSNLNNLSFHKSKMVLFNCLHPQHTQGCLIIAILAPSPLLCKWFSRRRGGLMARVKYK